jgi:hypothetical protein
VNELVAKLQELEGKIGAFLGESTGKIGLVRTDATTFDQGLLTELKALVAKIGDMRTSIMGKIDEVLADIEKFAGDAS